MRFSKLAESTPFNGMLVLLLFFFFFKSEFVQPNLGGGLTPRRYSVGYGLTGAFPDRKVSTFIPELSKLVAIRCLVQWANS